MFIILSYVVVVLYFMVTTYSTAYSSRISFIPSETTEIYCNGSICNGPTCLFNRTVTTTSNNYRTGSSESVYCGTTSVSVSWPTYGRNSYSDSYTKTCWTYKSPRHTVDFLEIPERTSYGTVSCSYGGNSCHVLRTSGSDTKLIAGPFSDCFPWFYSVTETLPFELSMNLKLVCFSKSTCPEGPCVYKAKPLRDQDEVMFSAGVKVLASCGSLKVFITCPQFEGKRAFCSDARKCYTYQSSDSSFNAMELVVKLPKEADANTTKLECKTEDNNCAAFRETSQQTGYAVGVPRFCFPWVEPESSSGLYLPSKHPNLICSSSISHVYGPERYRAELVSSFDGAYSAGAEVYFNCGALQVQLKCPRVNGTNLFCSETRKCFIYKSLQERFNVVEILVKKPRGLSTSEVECNLGTARCPIFKETSVETTFIIGFRSSCYPEITTA